MSSIHGTIGVNADDRPRDSGLERWSDGLILVIAGTVLFSPYLPHFGPFEGRIRFDNIALPLFTGLVVLERAMQGVVRITREVKLYVIFLGWLVITSLAAELLNYSWYSKPSITNLLAHLDAYVRPLMVLFIASHVSASRNTLTRLIRFILISAIPLCGLGILQLLPDTRAIAGAFVETFYYGDRTVVFTHFSRVKSVFGQYGTFGMYALLCVGLGFSQFLGLRLFKRWFVLLVILTVAFMGGVASASKVFVGGMAIFLLLVGMSKANWSRIIQPKNLGVLLSMLVTTGVMLIWYVPELTADIFFRFLQIDRVYETYVQARLNLDHPEQGKFVRSGIINSIKYSPIIVFGVLAVSGTTDSFWLGLTVMGGAVGVSIYLYFIFDLLRRLGKCGNHAIGAERQVARILMYLTVAFAAAAFGFHTFIQDRSGDLYWLLIGLVLNIDHNVRTNGDRS